MYIYRLKSRPVEIGCLRRILNPPKQSAEAFIRKHKYSINAWIGKPNYIHACISAILSNESSD